MTRRFAAGAVLLAAGGLAVAALYPARPAAPTEHTMFGGTPARNMADLAGKFGAVQLMPVKDGEKETKPADTVIRWQAELGSRAYGGPIIAGGKVFVGTNNERPRNPRDSKKNADGDVEPTDMGILMCFDQKTGNLLWQAVHDKLPSGQVNDWPKEGICSTPLVQGDRVYYVNNRCSVVCADVNGLADGNQGVQSEKYKDKTDADIIWELDMIGELSVFPHNMAACSPLLVGDVLFITTANGVDEGHINIPAPQAPSFVAIDKNSGKVLWKRNDPGKNIMHGQWSNATYAEIKGVKQVIFPGGDGVLRGFKPETGEVLWQFDCNPKDTKYELGGTGTRNDFIGTPVVYEDKIYIGVGQDPEHFSGVGHFWCIDPSKATQPGMDISPELGEWGQPGKPNPNSGLVWHYGGPDKRKFVPRDFVFGRTMSTATVVDGVVYIAELQGFVHCLDAKTGKKFWQYDLKGAIWGSTYYVDGKVYLATEGGDVFAFKHDKAPEVIDELDIPDATDAKDFNQKLKAKRKQVEAKYLLGKAEFDAPVRSTPVVADGVMYVMTEKTLYALEPKK
ncbi:MAG: PQQ-binding-like beta-propeller repeat protein [Gemmataceae bacterium]